jgi:hypothetical protein
MNQQPAFKLVCDACGSPSVKIESPGTSLPTAMVTCGRCDAPRGTVAALRDRSLKMDRNLLNF